MPNFDRIKAAQLEDARGHGWWSRLSFWLRRWKRRAQEIAAFGTAVGTLFTLGAGAWRYISNRRIPDAQPPAKDGERLTIDRVEKPKQQRE